MATIPFDDIVPGATVRFTVIDGVQYLSIRDFIMHMCDKDDHDAARIWRNMKSDRISEVGHFLSNFQFPGRGQSKQDVITFPGAIKLVMFLPGEKAKQNRSIMAKILIRYFAGDPSLIGEIEANAASDNPVAQMARATLASEKEQDVETLKRSREHAELMFELEVQERRERIARLKCENQKLSYENVKLSYENEQLGLTSLKKFKDFLSKSTPNWESDRRLVLQIEDRAKNIIFTSGSTAVVPAIEGETTTPSTSPSQSLSISQVAQEMKVRTKHADLVKIGKRVSQLYRQHHNNAPPHKHRQWVDGAEREVNSYTEADRGIIEQAWREWIIANRHVDQPSYTSDESSESGASQF